jgi:hypothetical protein
MVSFLAHIQTERQFENIPVSFPSVSKIGIWQTVWFLVLIQILEFRWLKTAVLYQPAGET